MVKKRDLSQRQTFEEQGETWVRHLLHTTDNKDDKAQASAWLSEQQIARDLEASSKRDAREEETLKIAKRANRIAIIAATSATVAAIAAITSAIITIMKLP